MDTWMARRVDQGVLRVPGDTWVGVMTDRERDIFVRGAEWWAREVEKGIWGQYDTYKNYPEGNYKTGVIQGLSLSALISKGII